MTRFGRVSMAAALLTAACAVPPTGSIALNDAASTGPGGDLLIPVLLNDRAPRGETLTIAGVGASAGSVSIVSGGQLAYRAAEGFLGDDRFTYTVMSESGSDAAASVVVTVGGPGTTTTTAPDDLGPRIEVFDVAPDLASPRDEVRIVVQALGTGSGVQAIEIRLDGELIRKCDGALCDVDIQIPTEGDRAIEATAIDNAGNSAADVRSVVIDATPPVISDITVEPPVPNSAEPFDVEVLASDEHGIDSVDIELDGLPLDTCPNSPCAIRAVGPMPPGTHVLRVVATDSVGNRSDGVVEFEIPEALPDLVVESFELLGPALEIPNEALLVPAQIVVANIGSAPAPPFGFSIRGEFSRSFILDGVTAFYHRISGLAPGESRALEIAVLYGSAQSDPDLLVVELDSCAGIESMPPYCDVLESSEDNNASAERAVDFPPIATIARPLTTADLVLVFGQPVTAFLDGTRSFDPDGSGLAYLWTVERNADGNVQDISSAASGEATFDLPFSCSPTNYRFTLTVTDPTGNSASTFRDIEYSHIC